jgi:hypothetical protein
VTHECIPHRTRQIGHFTVALWRLLLRWVATASVEEALNPLRLQSVTLSVQRSGSGRVDSPISRARERCVIPFRPLMLQCAVDPVRDVLTINTFVLGNPFSFNCDYGAPENGGATLGQLRGTCWHAIIFYVGLHPILSEPIRVFDIVTNDGARVRLLAWMRMGMRQIGISGKGGRRWRTLVTTRRRRDTGAV